MSIVAKRSPISATLELLLPIVTEGQTDRRRYRPTPSVTKGLDYLRSTAMRPNNTKT